MSTIKIASWNINSVRLRIDQVVSFLEREQPDILCLQEIKCQNDQFPEKAFIEAGYPHMAVAGQKGWHGVATVANRPIARMDPVAFCRHDHARHVAVKMDDIEVHNFYIPAGGDIPDPQANDKFAHKLDFLDSMTRYFAGRADAGDDSLVLTGDFNIAPHENDVWSHKQLLKVVSHTPLEVDILAGLQKSHDFIDTARHLAEDDDKLFSWWSYRSKDWTKNNRGRRLDHIWTSPALKSAVEASGKAGHVIHQDCRSWEKPSDHAPVTQILDLSKL